MEGKGRVGSSSSSSSSFTTQLFGPKEPSSSSTNFNSIFPPPSKETARNILSSKNGSLDQRKESTTCNLSSSLYYGGQDVYSRSTNNHAYPTVNKSPQPREDDDVNGNNSQDASRGNWWQGSLYY